MPETLQGRRIPDGTFFDRRNDGALHPGDYGVEEITKTIDGQRVVHRDWFCKLPDGSTTVLWVNEDDRNGNRHLITEFDDGTITVGGSIMGAEVRSVPIIGEGSLREGWHGFLEHGVWRRV